MPNHPVRAAGRTLTVGEIRQAIEGLSDNDVVTRDGQPIMRVAPSVSGIDLDGGLRSEEGRLQRIADEQRSTARQARLGVA